jgi:CHAT domain-containing protein
LPENETSHLTDGQIIALPEAGEEAVALHLRTCADCRARVAVWREALAAIKPATAGADMGITGNCPTMEELASYVGAEVPSGVSEAITGHIAGCARCAAILRDSLDETGAEATPMLVSSGRDWRRRMARDFAGRRKLPSHYWKYAAAAAVFVAVAGSLTFWIGYRRSHDPAALLAMAYTAVRPFDFRLPDSGYAPVRQRRGVGSTFDRPATLDSAVAAIRVELAANPQSASALELKGRAELTEGSYEAAIESLTRAVQGGDAGAQGDLGVAYAVRGEAENRNIDYGHAADLFLKALRQRPGDARVQFNLALIYEKLSLVDEAIEAWRQFLRGNPPAGWRQEAQAHLDAMEKIKAGKKQTDGRVLRDPAAFLAAYGAVRSFDPLPWWDAFWIDWLPMAASDKATAHAARIIADGFARLGEYSLIESLEARPGAAKQEGLALLARAMAANRTGHAGNGLDPAREAATKLDAAGMRAAAALARTEFVYSARWSGMDSNCLETSEKLAQSIRPEYPWLLGNAHLEHAGCLAQQGDHGRARSESEAAEAQLARSGLWPMALRAAQFKAVMDEETGNIGPVWDTAPEGLRRYWTSQATDYRAQAFEFSLQRAATQLGWRDCAVVFYRAAIRSAQRAGNGEIEAGNRARLAQLLQQMGDYGDEVRELDEVKRLLDGAGQGRDVRILRWEAALRRVETDLATGAARDPLPELDRLASTDLGEETSLRMDLDQTRGLAFVTRGDPERATEEFQRAIGLNARRMDGVRSWLLRFPMDDPVAASYRNLTQIQLSAGDAAKALATWQRFRPDSSRAPRSIAIAVLPAGIAIWAVDAGMVKVRWTEDSPGELRRAGEEFLALCASPSSSVGEIRRLGNRLYRALLRPELQSLTPGIVSLTADSWLSTIPYGALTDDAGGYLSRRFQFVQGYGPPATAPALPIGSGSSVLIVSAPAGAAPGGPALAVLASADREAAQVAARFSHAMFERDATVDWLAANAPRANVFHFCGHGWANGGNGALILPSGPNGEARFVTSANLAKQDWSRCQLAVLSACLTAAGETRGAVNNQSLVQALLSAGARRVVAARWSIDSEATRALMDGFYAGLVSGESVPEALFGAAADVAAVPAWSHPYYWAGFDVFGTA